MTVRRQTFAAVLLMVLAVLAIAQTGRAKAGAAARPAVSGHVVVATPTTATPPSKGALMSDGPDNRYQLGGTWLYRADPTNAGISGGWYRYNLATTGWSQVTMPNSYNAGNLSSASFAGSVGWYRRDFTLPQDAFASYVPKWAQHWVLQFESVNYSATVWLNGHKLGTHEGAYLPFEFTMKYLRTGVNQLIVRVDDRLNGGTFPHSGGGWWNYGGILDAVYMRPVSGSEIDNIQIHTVLTSPTGSATIQEQATVRNLAGRTEAVSLTGRYGTAKLNFGSAKIRPGGTWTPSASVVIASPKLWAPGSPYLYRATFTLDDSEGQRIAGYTYQSGIRQISLVGGQLYLNGRALQLRGVNLHEQTVTTGAALTLAQQRQLIEWVHQLGGTIIRAHYPLDPELEQMADQDGIMLWSEVPVYQTAVSYQALGSWRDQAVALVKANIEANQNHPSILVWSIGNELGSPPSPGQATYIKQAASAANKLDPTRPVGMAVEDWPGLGCQPAYAPLQVIGVNEYFGWFDAGGGTTDDRDELAPFMQSVRACYPSQGIIVSEFGFGGNRNGPVEARGTYQFQVNSIQYHVGVFNTLPWLSAAMYFPLQDFAAKPGFDGSDPLGTPPWVDKGVLDQYGNPKPSFAAMAALYQGFQQLGQPTLTTLQMPTVPRPPAP